MAKIYEARVSFYAQIEADSQEQADEQVNELMDTLGAVQTNVPWDDVTWDYTFASAPEGVN